MRRDMIIVELNGRLLLCGTCRGSQTLFRSGLAKEREGYVSRKARVEPAEGDAKGKNSWSIPHGTHKATACGAVRNADGGTRRG